MSDAAPQASDIQPHNEGLTVRMIGITGRIPYMDELDSEIISLLQTDARQSNRELARRLGVAPSTCLERVRALTRRGVIRGYHAEINPAALNRGVQAMVSVQVRPLSRTIIDTFKSSASAMPEVLSVFVLGGGDDFLLHVAVQDLDHLHAFLLDRLSKRREIAGFRTSVIFQQVHNAAPTRLPDVPDLPQPPAGKPSTATT
ncbi:Lrp/AsnC family transcriptional regulator [Streptosporangium sp. NPDC002607]